MKQGEPVLVHSAAGGVGLHALDLIKKHGAIPVGIVGSEAKREFLLSRNILDDAQVIVRKRETFAVELDRSLRSMEKEGFALILDSLYGPWFRDAYRRLLPGGRHIIYGAADMTPRGKSTGLLRLAWKYLTRPRVDPLAMISTNRSVMGFNLIWLYERVEELGPMIDELLALSPAKPHTGNVFPFENAVEAMLHLKSGETVGKVVLQA
jgi:alcohol dehydrogenase